MNYLLGFLFALFVLIQPLFAQEENRDDSEQTEAAQLHVLQLMDFILGSKAEQKVVREKLEANWNNRWVVPVLEVIHIADNEQTKVDLFTLLEQQTGQQHGYSLNAWFTWIWVQPEDPLPGYPELKAALYRLIDRKFEAYFSSARMSTIRLDEVRWGGVVQDGIPPLRNPTMIAAHDAGYLADTDVVFGLEINGVAQAYPKRIMAWHELFTNTIGGLSIAGVYCTLCGSMILYHSEFEGKTFDLGTSGFLYRSNKLMYDAETQSLWNTIWGKPVIGPLVGKGIQLSTFPVVTTTWGAWKALHPNTAVLSLETGYTRNYDEGEAYRDYFATDELMFNSSVVDASLPNKAEVLALRIPGSTARPFALSVDYLGQNPVYYNRLGETYFVVLTDASGASRVYQTAGLRFKRWDRKGELIDEKKRVWKMTEDALVNEAGERLARIPAHRAFWFGWKSAHPNTRLVR